MSAMGSLFAGIGGFDLGFERAGFNVAWQVEIDPYCRKVLARHFPKAERFEDVRECGKHNLRPVDVICGGFPCQDVSYANPGGEGLSGERSGLFYEALRVASELRPKFLLLENVAALLRRGLGAVLAGLAEIGYDAEWECIPANAMGSPHVRDRVWILAHPECTGLSADLLGACRASSARLAREGAFWESGWVHEPPGQHGRWLDAAPEARVAAAAWEHAPCEPLLLGISDGLSRRVDRLRGLGNAVVPQIPEMIARRLMEVLA